MAPPLPQKEAQIFKNILKLYEMKQYKKGLKQCELILRKMPEHGETLAMKGLMLNCLNKKEEAYAFVRLGLRHDLKSHVCWHVYGLLYRSDKNYDEAIKCYRNALRIDKDNMQILRDLSLLQIQMRDLEGFRSTRQQLVTLRAQNRVNWIGLALAYHLLGSHEMAANVLEAFEDTLKQGPQETSIQDRYDKSEMLMYKVQVLAEGGAHKQALEQLEACKGEVVDMLAWRELKADLLVKVGQKGEAHKMVRGLLRTNPDCRAYYNALEGLNLPEAWPEMYLQLKEEFPRSNYPKRRLLDITTGDEFRQHADTYMQVMIRKGAALFSTIKAIYRYTEKAAVFGELAEGYVKEYLASGRLTDKEDARVEAPSARLWIELFLAQHYDRLRQLDKALAHVDAALEHTPTFIELYVHKARIYRHAGDYQKAADLMNQARELDTADRFLNSKCVKYMLRADRVKEAEETVGLFTREGVDQVDNLVDMQCMWFEQRCGDSYLRQRKYGNALKNYHQVEKHFADITDDQFDFHMYCMRKMTLRSYVRLLRLEDKLRGHNYYRKAAHSAIQSYLDLYDKPSLSSTTQSETNSEDNPAGLSEKELKKLRSKQRRDQARQAAVKEEAPKATGDEKKSKSKVQDSDPDGQQLVSTTDPLGEAVKFLKPLLDHAKEDIHTHLLAAAIYLRRKKYLLVLRALKAAHSIDAANPTLHFLLVSFAHQVAQASDLHPAVKSVINEELPSLLSNKSAADLNAEFLNENSTNPLALCQGLKALAVSALEKKGEAAERLLASAAQLKGCSVEDAASIMYTLRNHFGDEAKAVAFANEARKVFPLATCFKA
eukprot:comp23996_c0_seq1/m.42678 comp23996_c0_seq1/g.42678  ORF comp23996_c0_seq1/g.42678 comp23996_c0_seq1/m.42678 type:complete len:829 (-) comp23996_c0_seq1:215-2701(-)